MLHSRIYYTMDGFELTETVSSYIERCAVEDNYTNISLQGLETVGELREYVDSINAHGDHNFFDLHNYMDGAYVCTIQAYTQSGINYLFIFDILNGKLRGSYTGYEDDETISDYCSGMVSDIIHAVQIQSADIKLSEIIQLVNRVNLISHHIFFDVSALGTSDYLVTFTYEQSGSNTTCHSLGLVNGTTAQHTYTTAELSTTTFKSFLDTYNARVATIQDIANAIANAITTALNTEV